MAKSVDTPPREALEMRDDLRRLIEAIDRRVPHLERLGEAAIARDAADLRQHAIALIGAIDIAVSPKS